MQYCNRVPSWITGVVLAVLIAPIALQIGCTLLPGFGSYIVLSGSMSPELKPGSLIYTYDTNDYQPGDVVTYSRNGAIVTHRIVRSTDDGVVTKGDVNDQTDPYTVAEKQIRGEVLFSVPRYGYVLLFVSSHIFSLGLVCVGLCTMYFGVRLFSSSAG